MGVLTDFSDGACERDRFSQCWRGSVPGNSPLSWNIIGQYILFVGWVAAETTLAEALPGLKGSACSLHTVHVPLSLAESGTLFLVTALQCAALLVSTEMSLPNIYITYSSTIMGIMLVIHCVPHTTQHKAERSTE